MFFYYTDFRTANIKHGQSLWFKQSTIVLTLQLSHYLYFLSSKNRQAKISTNLYIIYNAFCIHRNKDNLDAGTSMIIA